MELFLLIFVDVIGRKTILLYLHIRATYFFTLKSTSSIIP